MKFDTLTLGLLGTAALLAGVAASLALGAGQSVSWLPAAEVHEAASAPAPASTTDLPGQALALTWQQSMFSPDRQPDRETGTAATSSLDGAHLTGVIIDGQSQWVLLQLPDKRNIKLAVGSSLDSGWALTGVTSQQATFSHQGQTRQLRLTLLRLPPPSKALPITLPNVPTP